MLILPAAIIREAINTYNGKIIHIRVLYLIWITVIDFIY